MSAADFAYGWKISSLGKVAAPVGEVNYLRILFVTKGKIDSQICLASALMSTLL